MIAEWETELLDFGELPIQMAPAFSHGKVVYFMRHAESLANESSSLGVPENIRKTDPKYRDAHISSTGVKQATNSQEVINNLNFDLIVVSPLTRTMQTFCHAFDKHPHLQTFPSNIEITVSPLVCEFFTNYQECQGRNKSELLQEPKLQDLRLFQQLIPSIEQIEDEWWNIGDDFNRLTQFSSFIRNSPAKRIFVISHWGFIHNLFLRVNETSIRPNNCGCFFTVWRTAPSHYHLPSVFSNEELLILSSKPQSEKSLSSSSKKDLSIQYIPTENRVFGIILLPAGNHHKNGLLNEIISFINEVNDLRPQSVTNFGGLFHCCLTNFVPIKVESKAEHDQQISSIRNFLYTLQLGLLSQLKKTWSASNSFLKFNRNDIGQYSEIYFEINQKKLQDILPEINEFDLFFNQTKNSYQAYLLSQHPIADHLVDIENSNNDAIDNNNNNDDNNNSNINNDINNNVNKTPDGRGEDFDNRSLDILTILKKYPVLYGGVTGEVNYGWEYLFKKMTWRLALASFVPSDKKSFRIEEACSFPLW